jgi:hypothetical protein
VKSLLLFGATVLDGMARGVERLAELVEPGPVDACPYSWDPDHVCRRRDGRLIQPGEPCYTAAHEQAYRKEHA